MTYTREFWIRDLEQLLDETVVKDAVAQILEKFDEAVAALPTDNRVLISRYFDGVTAEQLAREYSASVSEIEDWIQRIKRELASLLRTKCQVKQ